MAAWLSNDGANSLLASVALPAVLYAQLHTGDPTVDGTANVSGETSRISFSLDTAAFGATSNVDPILWPSLAGAIGETITHITAWNSPTGGTCWEVAELDTPAGPVASGDTLTIPGGVLAISFTTWS